MTTYGGAEQKSYKTLLDEALDDESKAGNIYRYMANVSPNASAADRLRRIAADEDRHHLMVGQLIAELTGVGETGQQYTERMEYMLGYRHPSQMGTVPSAMPDRIFPGMRGEAFVYGDWVDLAEDIKSKYPDDPVMRASVNYQLQHIAEETEEAEEAKRWLMQKAGELGIR